MIIGSLGKDITFMVTPETVKTLDNMEWTISAKYAEHNRLLRDNLKEFLGQEGETITFDVELMAVLGVNVMKEMINFMVACRTGKVLPLKIGKKLYGKYRWVVKDVKIVSKQYDNQGNLFHAQLKITLNDYSQR